MGAGGCVGEEVTVAATGKVAVAVGIFGLILDATLQDNTIMLIPRTKGMVANWVVVAVMRVFIVDTSILDFGAQRFALAASGRDETLPGSRRKLKARNRLEKRAESHLSAARCVSRCFSYSLQILGDHFYLCSECFNLTYRPNRKEGDVSWK